jgi:Mg2+/Co2+ transporter CorB
MSVDDVLLASVIGILSIFVLVIANGFFVASEFSLVAIRRSRVAQLVAAGRRKARLDEAWRQRHLRLRHDLLADDSHRRCAGLSVALYAGGH